MNEIYIKYLYTTYVMPDNPSDLSALPNFSKKMQDNDYQDRFYNKNLKPEGGIKPTLDEYKKKLTTVWYKDYPCIANNTKMFTEGGYSYVKFTSSDKANGIVKLNSDGTFSTEDSTRYPVGGKWSCTKTGKIFLQDKTEPATDETQQSTSTTTTATPKFTWQEVSIIPQDVAQGNKLVKFGMKGDIVSTIQQYLIDNGFPNISKTGKPDGKFGKRTYNSIIDFQKSKGLEKVEGIVGKETWAALTKPKDTDTDTNTTNNNEIPDMNKLTVSPDYNPEFKKENHMKKLNNIIKESLIETKVNKKKTIQESKITNLRFKMIVESETKQDLNTILEEVLMEMIYLHNQGFNSQIISENVDDVFNVLSKVFKKSQGAIVGTFKEKGVNYIITNLGMEKNTYLKNFLTTVLGNTNVVDIPKLFTDCDYLTKKIAEAIPEAYLRQLEYDKGMGNVFMDGIRNALHDVINQSDFAQRIEQNIAGVVCPIVDKLAGKFEDSMGSMKSKLIGNIQA